MLSQRHPIDEALLGDFDDLPLGVVPIDRAPPSQLIQNEKPVHRIMCYLAASGKSPIEIAEATGFSAVQVRTVLAQDRSRELIALILRENFDADVTNILKSAAVDAVIELQRLATSAESESVRRSSCSDILDRFQALGDRGKAKTPRSVLAEIEEAKQHATS